MLYNKIKLIWFYLFVILFAIFSLLCLNQAHDSKTKLSAHFVVSSGLKPDNVTTLVFFESYIIPQPSYLLSAHSSTVEVLPDGALIALWFAGSHEGKPDVNIWQSYFKNGKWSDATSVVTRNSLTNDTQMFIKKLGNPVIYKAANGYLHLFVVSVSIGGWSGSSINHLISKDNGKTYTTAQKIILTPFFNISTLIRTHPISLDNGGFCLPVYHESIRTYPELLYFDKYGNLIYQQRINDKNHFIQPSFVATSPTSAFVYFRNHIVDNLPIAMQITEDSGKTWSGVKNTNIYNQDSSMATINLSDGRLLMVRNMLGRSKLLLSLSSDGVTWHDVAELENFKNGEFSYPSIQIHDDIVDILYTWQRKKIKHVRFNSAWLNKQENLVSK